VQLNSYLGDSVDTLARVPLSSIDDARQKQRKNKLIMNLARIIIGEYSI
jgi:hypothetical protein